MKKLNLFLLALLAVSITQAQSLAVTATVIQNVSCHGGDNGTATSNPSGGTSPYTYLWSPGGQSTQTATGLIAATYTVRVTDHIGNTASASTTVNQPVAPIVISAWAKASSVCPGQSDSLFSSGSGGTIPYIYTWTGPIGDISCASCQNTNAYPYGAAYVVTAINDANGCTASASVSITVNPFPYVTIEGPLSPVAVLGNDTLIALSPGASSYLWSNSATTSTIIVSPAITTTYSVETTNSYGCLDTAKYTVSPNSSGNGNSSGTAIAVSPSTSVTTTSYSSLDSVMWFSFVAADSNNQIIAYSPYLGMPVAHVHRLTLYDNSMNMLVDEHMPDIVGANQIRIDISHLHIGSTYYVRAARCPAHANMAGCNPSASGECNPSMRWDFQMCFRTVPVFVPDDSGSEAPSVSQLYYEHRGQISDLNDIPRFDIKAYTNFASPAVFVSDSAISFVYSRAHKSASVTDTAQRVDMTLTGAYVEPSQPVFKMEEDSNAGYLNYFKEYVPNGATKIEGYARLVYKNVYSNVDMHVYSNSAGTKLYFVCNPASGGNSAGNPANIELEFKGATSVNVTGSGALQVITLLDTLTFAPGFAYTDSAGIVKPKSWHANFIPVNSNTVRFNTGSYNTSEPLIIQVDRGHFKPSNSNCIDNLCWDTYYGGINSGDIGQFNGVTHDDVNGIYAAGYTTSANFPVRNGIQTGYHGNDDAVIVKFQYPGYGRQWATYFGGSGTDIAYAVAADSIYQNVYITGSTNSTDLPQAANNQGYYQAGGLNGTGSGPNTDIFIAKISIITNNPNTPPVLSWSTYYGGPGNEVGYGIATDTFRTPHDLGTHNLYIVGTGDVNTPLYHEAGAYSDSTSGTGLILRFNTDGLLKWATLIGANDAVLYGCTTDFNNNLFVTGTSGSGYPIAGSGFSYNGNDDAVITKFNASNAIVWSGYYGGDGNDYGKAIVTDAGGNAFITGYTTSPSSSVKIELAQPKSWSYYQDTNANGTGSGAAEVFLAKFAASNGSLLWGTYFNVQGHGYGLTIDANQNLYLTGEAGPFIFTPATQPAGAYVQTFYPFSLSETFVAAFNVGEGYYWGTYLGEPALGFGSGNGIIIYDKSLFVAGNTSYSPRPFVNPGGGAWFQDTNISVTGTSSIGFMAEFNLNGIATGENTIKAMQKGELKVYPNPTNQSATVQLSMQQAGDVEISIINLFGQTVFTKNFPNQQGSFQQQISLSALSNGAYIIKAATRDNVYYTKIAKLQ